MTWQLPDTYHLAGHGRGTATLKFYEGRDILAHSAPHDLLRRPTQALRAQALTRRCAADRRTAALPNDANAAPFRNTPFGLIDAPDPPICSVTSV